MCESRRHICIVKRASHAIRTKCIPLMNKCYLCHSHTHTSCRAGMQPACWQRAGCIDSGVCVVAVMGGGVMPGQTKGAHSSKPPASHPSIPPSRRERRQRNVSQACRRDVRWFPEVCGFVCRRQRHYWTELSLKPGKEWAEWRSFKF